MVNSWNIKHVTNSFDNLKSLARKNTIWKPLGLGWFKLNFGGVAKGNPGIASIGSVIRDCKENLVVGFPRGIGIHYFRMTKSQECSRASISLPL